MTEYHDGHTYCFSCHRYRRPRGLLDNKPGGEYSLQSIKFRGIEPEISDFYGITTAVDPEGNVAERWYPYPKTKELKVRLVKDKKFFWRESNKGAGLFGADKFQPGGAALIITEGEEDAPSGYQMLRRRIPVVSVRSSSSAKADIIADWDFVNSFDRVYLSFDPDTPGQKAALDVQPLFQFNKLFQLKLARFKDANEALTSGSEAEFRAAFDGAGRFLPEGVVSSFSEFRRILTEARSEPIGTYPYERLRSMVGGLRGGQFILITANEGIGKTEVVRAFEHHLLQSTDLNIAALHLEEPQDRQLQGLAGLELGKHCHKDDSFVPPDEVLSAVEKLCRRDNRYHMYHHPDVDDPTLIFDSMRFLGAAADCKIITLDHITHIVTGLGDGKERENLDYICTKFVKLLEELNVCLILVSHINDDGKTRGSRYISKVAHVRIDLHRNHEAEDPLERDTTRLFVSKNRPGGITGWADTLYFDHDSFSLSTIPPARLPPLEVA